MPTLRMSYGKLKKHVQDRMTPSHGDQPSGHGSKKGRFSPKFWNWAKIRRYSKYVFLAGIGVSLIFIAWVGKDLPDPNRLNERVAEESTKIYDRSGEHLLYEIYADKKRTIVELDKLPKYLINGLVATEDTKFYEHHGIRPLSIARSFVNGFLGRGRIGGGASTLTQQLIKNAVLINEQRGPVRKAKEIILAVWLEQKYSKEDILKIYFNEVPYGSTNYGIESAAQSYFGKHVQDLTLAEAATLAGLPQQPSVFLNNLDALKTRRNFVLQRMVDEGYLSKEEADKAKAEELKINKTIARMDAPHFVQYVQEQLIAKYGENTVERGGLRVITTLDWDKQEKAEKAIEQKGETLLKEGGANNAALLALDPKNAQVLAMVGSRDFYNKDIGGEFNVTTKARRQPGSSIKPMIYAAAFEKGYTPSTVLYDVVTPFGSYVPRNYDLSERGPVTMRMALQGSLNIPAVKTLYLVGQSGAETFTKKMGYTTFNKDELGLSLVLGGGGVKMIEHVNAFGIFANNGQKHEPVSILKVSDSHGKVLDEWKEENGEQVISKELAATMSNVLSDDAARAYVFGAGSALTLPGRPVAAKTGTTNNYVDAWVVGYTPSLVAGVWAGNSDNKPMRQGYGGSRVAGEIWNYFMRETLKDTPVERFPEPPANKSDKPVLNGGAQGSVTAMVNKLTGRLATSSTPAELIVTRTFLAPHDILYYVDKNDPQGPVPTNPAQDPMFNVWENAAQNWINRKREKDPNWDVSFSEPPTEYDDEESLGSIPTVNILSPSTGERIGSRTLDLRVNAFSTRGVVKVIYRIDGRIVGVSTEAPFNMQYEAETESPGEHTLQVTAEDDLGTHGEQSIQFFLNVESSQSGVHFNGAPKTLSRNQFPASFYLRPFKLEDIKKVTVTGQLHGAPIVLYENTNMGNLFDNSFVFVWNSAPSENGVWNLTATVELNNGSVRVSDTAAVEVKN